jgi:antitoxin ParD1/3/4
MNVSLPAGLARFVEEAVGSGDYGTASEVVREGLRLLQARREAHAAKLSAFRREIEIGLADIEAGRFSDDSIDDIMAEVEAEYAAEMAERARPAQ